LERVTHRIGFRHLTDGVWREPGDLVDASAWPNRHVLEQNGYLHPLSDAERARLESSSPTRPSSVAPIPNTKAKTR
jgi:hypothetical protein